MIFSNEHTTVVPITTLVHPVCDAASVRVDVQRLDLLHPYVNGNKWFKLKYNLQRTLATEHRTLLTFGGPWSNHIYSTAAAGAAAGIQTIGVIRGEEPALYSNTLRFAREQGMELRFVSRLDYEERNTEEFKAWLHDEYGAFHLVPEGGSNYYGVNGCMEILTEHELNTYSYFACACGTGATLAGMLVGSKGRGQFIGFSALKGGAFLQNEVINHIDYLLMDRILAEEFRTQFTIETAYHFGGYGKWNEELIAFIQEMEHTHDLPLDQVYTGKALSGLLKKIEAGEIERGSNVLFIHTGGLQGRAGCSELPPLNP
ncbi:MAG: 1-aminocyclopropane-1-carboxylate deaminase/D-cysteine desulfhydrase, partial [Flavobacteriales bacterium]